MQRKLIEAAKQGDVITLHNMIKDDPFLLRAVALFNGDNPLHIACISGNHDFVKEVLSLRPEFALEMSRDGLSPLHIASVNGDLEIVKKLLKVGSHLCLVKGKDGRISLHDAVSNGRMQAIEELLLASLYSFREVTARGENCFHLAVKNNRFEAFKFLVQFAKNHDKIDVLNERDFRGNSILHVAAYGKQYEVLDFLLDENFSYHGKLEDINSINKSGLTPLDLLLSQGGDCEIEEMLRAAGARRVQEIQSTLSQHDSMVSILNPSLDQFEQVRTTGRTRSGYKKLQEQFKYCKIKDSPSKVRNTLLVIAVLMATATYQAVLSPPGGVWQDDSWNVDNSTAKKQPSHIAGKAIMATHMPVSYGIFLLSNSIGFFMSLHFMYFLTCEFPLQFELIVSLMALTVTYDTCMVALTPGNLSLFFVIISSIVPILISALSWMLRYSWKGR